LYANYKPLEFPLVISTEIRLQTVPGLILTHATKMISKNRTWVWCTAQSLKVSQNMS